MRICMLKTENGSVDGVRVRQYVEGQEYDLDATDGERELAEAFVNAGLAVDANQQPAASLEHGAESDKKRPGRKQKAE